MIHEASPRGDVSTDYDAIADEWDRTRQRSWGEFEFMRPFFKNPLNPPLSEGKLKVLDAGCGNGRLIKWLDQELSGYDYLGVDSSVELLKKAQVNFPNHKFKKADLAEFSQPDNFDLIACVAVLHHLPSRADRLKVLQNIHVSLNSGGRLFLTIWNLWQPRYLKYVLKSYLSGQSRDCRIPFAGKIERFVHAFTKPEIRKLLAEAGFRKIEVFYTSGENKAGRFTGRNLVCLAEK